MEVENLPLPLSFNNDMNPYKYTISLRLWHPTSSLKDTFNILSQIPGITAGRLMDIGEQRYTIKGGLLEGSYIDSRCHFSFSTEWQNSDAVSLEDALNVALKLLESNQTNLREVTTTKGKAEFFIGIAIDANSGVVLSSSFLKRLADFSLELALDLYPSDAQVVQ